MVKRSELSSSVSMPTSTLGERIKAIRLTWKWSQEEMANVLRVDQASISFWERDKIRPSGSAVVALASLFRTSVEALEGGSGFHIPEPPSNRESSKANRGVPRSVSLPMGGQEVIVVLDLGDGSYKDLPLSEAMMTLVQGVKDSRRSWVVLE